MAQTDGSRSDHFLIVRQIRTAEDTRRVLESAMADAGGHVPMFPTNLCELNGEVIGSLSIGSTPLSGMWAHSQKCSARHTREMANYVRVLSEQLLTPGGRFISMCSRTSPIFPFMEKLGFQAIGETVLFISTPLTKCPSAQQESSLPPALPEPN